MLAIGAAETAAIPKFATTIRFSPFTDVNAEPVEPLLPMRIPKLLFYCIAVSATSSARQQLSMGLQAAQQRFQ